MKFSIDSIAVFISIIINLSSCSIICYDREDYLNKSSIVIVNKVFVKIIILICFWKF